MTDMLLPSFVLTSAGRVAPGGGHNGVTAFYFSDRLPARQRRSSETCADYGTQVGTVWLPEGAAGHRHTLRAAGSMNLDQVPHRLVPGDAGDCGHANVTTWPCFSNEG